MSYARALLYGFAFENAAKAKLILNGAVSVERGSPTGLRTDHNILELVKHAGYKPDKEETGFLKLIGYQLRILSRYPIAKNVDVQHQFTGRAAGATP